MHHVLEDETTATSADIVKKMHHVLEDKKTATSANIVKKVRAYWMKVEVERDNTDGCNIERTYIWNLAWSYVHNMGAVIAYAVSNALN